MRHTHFFLLLLTVGCAAHSGEAGSQAAAVDGPAPCVIDSTLRTFCAGERDTTASSCKIVEHGSECVAPDTHEEYEGCGILITYWAHLEAGSDCPPPPAIKPRDCSPTNNYTPCQGCCDPGGSSYVFRTRALLSSCRCDGRCSAQCASGATCDDATGMTTDCESCLNELDEKLSCVASATAACDADPQCKAMVACVVACRAKPLM